MRTAKGGPRSCRPRPGRRWSASVPHTSRHPTRRPGAGRLPHRGPWHPRPFQSMSARPRVPNRATRNPASPGLPAPPPCRSVRTCAPSAASTGAGTRTARRRSSVGRRTETDRTRGPGSGTAPHPGTRRPASRVRRGRARSHGTSPARRDSGPRQHVPATPRRPHHHVPPAARRGSGPCHVPPRRDGIRLMPARAAPVEAQGRCLGGPRVSPPGPPKRSGPVASAEVPVSWSLSSRRPIAARTPSPYLSSARTPTAPRARRR